MLPDVPTPEFPEQVLTEDEKCSLFYTISHTVNKTARYNYYLLHIDYYFLYLYLIKRPGGDFKQYPNEDGVASFRHDREQAIAVNRLLLGIAAGLIGVINTTVHEVLEKLDININIENVPDGPIDPFKVVTIFDILAIELIEALHKENTIDSIYRTYSANGKWNSTDDSFLLKGQVHVPCTTSYRLIKWCCSFTTEAVLRGGLDGYSIGSKIPKILAINPNILSYGFL